MRSRSIVLASVFAAVLFGIFIYGTSVNYYTTREFTEKTHTAMYQESEVLAKMALYGVVQSVDSAHGSFTMSWLNPFTTTPGSVTVHVTEMTDFEKEELQADETGTYVGLSPRTPGTFSDIQPGTRVAVTFEKSGSLVATDVLFGNPL